MAFDGRSAYAVTRGVQDWPYASFSHRATPGHGAAAQIQGLPARPPVDPAVYAAILDGVQLVLDGVGLIPGFGEFADGLNAFISGLRGDYVGAALSIISTVPVAGYVGNALKAGRHLLPGGMVTVLRGLGEPTLRAIVARRNQLQTLVADLPRKLPGVLRKLRRWRMISDDAYRAVERACEPVARGIAEAFEQIMRLVDEALGHPPVRRLPVRGLPPGTRLAVRDAAEFGIPPALAESMQKYATQHKIRIQLRGSSQASMRQRLRGGVHFKPVDLKCKTINEIDVSLGIGRPEDIGLVGYAKPRITPTDPGWHGLTPAQQARARMRLEEFDKNADRFRKLQDGRGFHRVGRVEKASYTAVVDPHGVVRATDGKPFAGDIDVFNITHADGTPLDTPRRAQHMRDLYDMSDYAVQHPGFTVDWKPTHADDIVARERMMQTHGPRGDENLLDITPHGLFTGRGPDPATYRRYQRRP